MWEVFFFGTARRTDSQRSASNGGTVMAIGRVKAAGEKKVARVEMRGTGANNREAMMGGGVGESGPVFSQF